MAEKGRSPKKGGKKGAPKEVVPRESGPSEAAVEPTDLRHLVTQMMADPSMNAALQQHLSSMVGTSSGYVESLPASVQRRIRALKNNQVEIVKVDAQFHQEVCALQASFEKKYQEVYDKRERIIAGSYEPTDEESHWEEDKDDLDEEEEEEEEGDDKVGEEKVKNTEDEIEGKSDVPSDSKEEGKEAEGTGEGESKKKDASKSGASKEDAEEKEEKGIPNFWLTAMKNAEVLETMMKEWDEPILEHLRDVRVVYPDEKGYDFILEFHFADNEYFTNKVLTKRYNIKCEVDGDSPFEFEGPEIVAAVGCEIQWNKGKNVTMKTVKKTQKHKSQGKTRVVTKTVKQESFFQFFENVPDPNDVEDPDDEEEQEKRALDFTRGEFFRDNFISRAVLYFTGEAQEEDFDDEDEDDDYVGEDGDSDEGDPDYKLPVGDGGQPQECKQQ